MPELTKSRRKVTDGMYTDGLSPRARDRALALHIDCLIV